MELPENDPLFMRQVELELHMQGRGAVRYRQSIERSRSAGRESDTEPGLRLLKQTVEPVADAIEAFLKDSALGKVGRRMTSAKLLEGQDPKTVAYLVCRSCIDWLQKTPMLSTASLDLAGIIEHEAQFSEFAHAHPGLFKTLLTHLDNKLSSQEYRRKALLMMVNKFDKPWTKWTMTDRMHIGSKLIEIFNSVTGFFDIKMVKKSRVKADKRIFPAPVVLEWIANRELRGELTLPFLLPMIYPPKPWDQTCKGGGYYTPVIPSLHLVKSASKRQKEMMKAADLSLVLSAVNALQATPWVINRPVFEVMTHCWEKFIPVGDLPMNDDEALPNKPHDIETNEEARKAWRKIAAPVHAANTRARSTRIQITRTLETARKFVDEAAIYFPYQLDFRGRAYVVGVGGVNPQGADYGKSLVTFANGKPILTDTDLDWLKIHGANVFGFDKASLQGRVDWVAEHHDLILRSAADPIGERWWSGADKPWCFLAFCFEYAGFVKEGWGFVSSLPIALDGTCNGLQHFSAMLRDPVGGRAVNLVPSNEPQDIYAKVAEVVIERLTELASGEVNEETWIAQGWLAYGIDRKLTKRPVMVLPYGGTRFSCLQYIREAFDEKVKAGLDNPFGDQIPKAVGFLSKIVWDAIGQVVVAARRAMTWLQQVAKTANQPFTWTTPSGFPVVQGYRQFKDRRVKTIMGDAFVFLSFKEPTDKLDKGKQALAISPNFVHSMDASAMMETVRLCRANDVQSFAMIHDSYGTVAADTETMAMSLRMAFVDMYRTDVLQQFLVTVAADLPPEVVEKLPPVPPKGSLDLDQVLASPFFFS